MPLIVNSMALSSSHSEKIPLASRTEPAKGFQPDTDYRAAPGGERRELQVDAPPLHRAEAHLYVCTQEQRELIGQWKRNSRRGVCPDENTFDCPLLKRALSPIIYVGRLNGPGCLHQGQYQPSASFEPERSYRPSAQYAQCAPSALCYGHRPVNRKF
jgi:hypothetical protein